MELLFGVFVFLQDAGVEQFVDELLHGIEGGEEALRRHDDADAGAGNGSFSFFFRLECDEVVTDHAAREVNLTNAVCVNFSFFDHNDNPLL